MKIHFFFLQKKKEILKHSKQFKFQQLLFVMKINRKSTKKELFSTKQYFQIRFLNQKASKKETTKL